MYILLRNKKIFYDYEIKKKREAGIVLQGHEVKSIKQQHCSIQESIIRVSESGLYIINMYIKLYSHTSLQHIGSDYNTQRPRKLLLHQREIAQIVAQTTKTGLTPLLLDIHISKHNRIKASIGVGKKKKKVQKKQQLKEVDIQRQADRELKRLGM